MNSFTYGEPIPRNYHMHDVSTPNGASRVNERQISWYFGSLYFSCFVKIAEDFSGVNPLDAVHWHGRARYPGPDPPSGLPGISIEFLNVCGWLSRGDLALESQAQFLAVAEHGLTPLEHAMSLRNFAKLAVLQYGAWSILSGCHSWGTCRSWE